jgi:hypothetical protein
MNADGRNLEGRMQKEEGRKLECRMQKEEVSVRVSGRRKSGIRKVSVFRM